ncbi:MAG: DUF2073 domain-containing protein [Candidatus Pacearchaeota archaeon]|nr:DUF2073 domain-containing protein [Candidatus Pacearchaeota archaeon]
MSKDKLTLSFIPYADVSKLDSVKRIKKILDIVLLNRIVILQGRLEPTEEASLIQSTMALVGRVKNFKGVELAVVKTEQKEAVFDKIKLGIARALVGERDALTVIGPASLVREIKKNPGKIDLMLRK